MRVRLKPGMRWSVATPSCARAGWDEPDRKEGTTAAVVKERSFETNQIDSIREFEPLRRCSAWLSILKDKEFIRNRTNTAENTRLNIRNDLKDLMFQPL